MRFAVINLSRQSIAIPLMLAGMAIVFVSGCANTRIPRIDPNGSGLFAADGSSTEIIRPFSYGESDFRIPWFPKPAFSTDEESSTERADSQASSTVGYPGAIWVSPEKIAIPVGSEVVLHAGLIGSNGQLSVARRLDWTITEGQPGSFVKAGGGNPSNMQFLFPSLGSKATERYANVITAKSAEQVHQGTNTANDDIMVGPGQGWVTVTSKDTGNTRVAVGATAEPDWNQQFSYIDIEWIDVKWQFPEDQSVSAGESASLVTYIERPSSGTPIQGWTVRYRIRTTNNEDTVHEIQTDTTGTANIVLDPQDISSGSAQVLIEVIRPPLGDADETIVGRGSSLVTWNAPGLQLRATRNISMNVGDKRVLTAIVENPGNQVARNVVLVGQSPSNISVTNTSPPRTSQLESDYWELGDLPPNVQKRIEIQINGTVAGESTYRLIARSDDGLQSESIIPIQIDGFPILLTVDGPDTAGVGDVVTYRYILENPTAEIFANVEITATLDDGLVHVTQNDPTGDPTARQVRFTFDQIQPQQGAGKAISFKIREPGQQCHMLSVKLANGQTIERKVCLDVTETSPDLSVSSALDLKIEGPNKLTQSKPEQLSFTVTNTSEQDLTGVSITVKLPNELQAQLASDGHKLVGNDIILQIESLAPGESDVLVVQVLPIDASEKVVVRATASDSVAESEGAIESLDILIIGPTAQDTPAATNEPPLVLKVFELHDPIQAGKENTYFVIVKNTGNTAISNIQVIGQLSKGMRFSNAEHPLITQPTDVGVDTETGQITFPVIPLLNAGESSPSFKVSIINDAVGDSQLIISATAEGGLTAKPVSETTTAR